MNQLDTMNVWQSWSPGMAVPLTLFKKEDTPDDATSDPFADPITLTACRKRNVTNSMMMMYADVIGMRRTRLFEIWPNADGQPNDIISEQDVLQEADTTRWAVIAKPETIFDNATLALCIPE